MDEPKKGIKLPWWYWLIVIIFPIPMRSVPWEATAIFAAIFVIVTWAVVMDARDKSSK